MYRLRSGDWGLINMTTILHELRTVIMDTAVGVKFPMGHLAWTPGAAELMGRGLEAGALLDRHLSGDWGDVCPGDRRVNDDALAHGGRLFSAYDTEYGRLWIITESDRSVTTLLRPEEY